MFRTDELQDIDELYVVEVSRCLSVTSQPHAESEHACDVSGCPFLTGLTGLFGTPKRDSVQKTVHAGGPKHSSSGDAGRQWHRRRALWAHHIRQHGSHLAARHAAGVALALQNSGERFQCNAGQRLSCRTSGGPVAPSKREALRLRRHHHTGQQRFVSMGMSWIDDLRVLS